MSEIRCLSRAQRRQMQKLADKIDRITQADRRFFERFPVPEIPRPDSRASRDRAAENP